MEKALDLVLVLRGTKNVLNLWSINILGISAKQVRYAGSFSLGVQKTIVYILKMNAELDRTPE